VAGGTRRHQVGGAAQIGEVLEFLWRHDATVAPDTGCLSLPIEPI
jgi:hypothetical protein